MNERLTKPVPVPPSWKYLLLKQMALPELDKVLSIESYAEVTKRNGDDNELDSVKSYHWTVFKRKKNVLSTGHRTLEGVSQLKRNRSQNYTGYAPSNSFSKDNEKSQPQPQKKGRPSIIDSGDENWTFIPEVDYFRLQIRTACFFVMLEWVFVTWHRFAY